MPDEYQHSPNMASSTNSSYTNGHSHGLRVLVVGAGIGGLAAAIALRQQGHDVTIFESSQFAREVGAAIHMAPNANGLLKRLGVDTAQIGANECLGLTSWAANGKQIDHRPFGSQADIWQHVSAFRIALQ